MFFSISKVFKFKSYLNLLKTMSTDLQVPKKSYMPMLISIEGNIGAGKSTILNQLKTNFPNYCFVDEPVAIWNSIIDENGKSLLETYYHDRFRWSYTFQTCALLNRYHSIQRAVKESPQIAYPSTDSDNQCIYISERCMDSDFKCFTRMQHADGAINKMEMEIYELYYNHLRPSSMELGGIIYLKVPPETCQQRIRQRNRKGEDALTLDYLRSVDYWTTNWIEQANVPVLTLDESFQPQRSSEIIEFVENLSQSRLQL